MDAKRITNFNTKTTSLIWALLILEPFRHFTYVTAHYPTFPSVYLRHSSFSNPSVASPTSQFVHQSFFRIFYVTGSSLTSPGEPPMIEASRSKQLVLHNALHITRSSVIIIKLACLTLGYEPGVENLSLKSICVTCGEEQHMLNRTKWLLLYWRSRVRLAAVRRHQEEQCSLFFYCHSLARLRSSAF